MVELVQEFVNLLLIPPGNLIYHLVLAFSIVGALLSAMNQHRYDDAILGKRTVVGLVLLLAFRLLLFLGAAIAWQVAVNEHLYLPPLDRAVTLVSLVIIAWLWCFPKPYRSSDILTFLFGLVMVIFAAVNLILWVNQGSPEMPFNGYEASLISHILALITIVAGSLILIIRHPNGWGFGLAMFILLAAGHTVSIILPSPDQDYSGIVRLSEIIAYPLLFTLPQRFYTGINQPSVSEVSLEEHRRHGLDPILLQSFFALGIEKDPEKLCQSITTAVAHTLVADLCFLASPPDEQDDIVFESGYDLIREEPFPGFSVKAPKLPSLTSAFQQNEVQQIHPDSHAPDLTNLAHSLNIPSAGDLLAAPITGKGEEVIGALILLTPYSGRCWSEEDQSTLKAIAQSLSPLLQRHISQTPYYEEIAVLQQKLQEAEQEIYRLTSQVKVYESMIGEESRLGVEPGSQISTIEPHLEFDHLDGHQVSIPKENALPQGFLAMKAQTTPNDQIIGELHLALEEIDRLNKKIFELEQADREYLNHPDILLPSGTKLEVPPSIAQQLDSPVSSINGYTDFLLAESFGRLGPIQRKFVERIKFSCERINQLLGITPESNLSLVERLQLHPENLNLSEIIDSTIERFRFEMLEKKLTLDRTQSEEISTVYADREALEQVLTSLLENAITITPDEGKISICVQKKVIDEAQYKVLIQISDQGGSDAATRTYRIFTSQPEVSIDDTSHEGIDMAMLKDLVEMQGGSIWIEVQEELGSTVNLLIPISSYQTEKPAVEDNDAKPDQENKPQTEGDNQE